MSDRSGKTYAGQFQIEGQRWVAGELTLNGKDTSLLLHSSDFFSGEEVNIQAKLNEGTRASLFYCHRKYWQDTTSVGGPSHYSACIEPQLVFFGDESLAEDEKRVLEVRVLLDDAAVLFNDHASFGFAINANAHIEALLKANGTDLRNPKVPTIGDAAQIFYYTGKREIFRVDTVFGTISATNNPCFTLPGPSGFNARNSIYLSIEVSPPIHVEDALDRLVAVLRFMELIVGRPQNILDLKIKLQSQNKQSQFLDGYWCIPPSRQPDHEWHMPHPVDNLVDAAHEPEMFARLLDNWLERQQLWREPRAQFGSVFALQNLYTIDRLVAAANMFDLLPREAFASEVPLCERLREARDEARKLFKRLEQSLERDSVLGDLSRVGRRVLKRKVRERARVVQQAIGEKLPDIEVVLDLAVECRNRFVHGTDARLTYEQNLAFMSFFTRALQFVFAASDLADCGWDLQKWSSGASVGSHPFAHFRIYYLQDLARLRSALSG
jgi:hypothetical protein